MKTPFKHTSISCVSEADLVNCRPDDPELRRAWDSLGRFDKWIALAWVLGTHGVDEVIAERPNRRLLLGAVGYTIDDLKQAPDTPTDDLPDSTRQLLDYMKGITPIVNAFDGRGLQQHVFLVLQKAYDDDARQKRRQHKAATPAAPPTAEGNGKRRPVGIRCSTCRRHAPLVRIERIVDGRRTSSAMCWRCVDDVDEYGSITKAFNCDACERPVPLHTIGDGSRLCSDCRDFFFDAAASTDSQATEPAPKQ